VGYDTPAPPTALKFIESSHGDRWYSFPRIQRNPRGPARPIRGKKSLTARVSTGDRLSRSGPSWGVCCDASHSITVSANSLRIQPVAIASPKPIRCEVSFQAIGSLNSVCPVFDKPLGWLYDWGEYQPPRKSNHSSPLLAVRFLAASITSTQSGKWLKPS
jgi:hypothetical protein